MSVRPVTASEAAKADCHPWTYIYGTMGLLMGVQHYMNKHKVNIHSKQFVRPGTQNALLSAMTLGALAGISLAKF